MKTYQVMIPIAGHVTVTVEAENRERAIAKAMETKCDPADADWETLDRFHQGNVCYCPSPWEVDATEVDPS